MDGLPEYVLAHQQLVVEWQNSHPVRLDDLTPIKREAARPIALFAGAAAVRAALDTGADDELRILRYPVRLGAGKPLRRDFSLIEERKFTSGALLSRYAISKGAQE